MAPSVRGAAARCAILLLWCGVGATAQVTPHFPDRGQDVARAQDALWIGTERGLYQYRENENVWSARSRESGLLSNRITRLATDQDVLWIGTDLGVSRFDLRSNTVLSYDSSSGFPPGRVLCFAFDPEYVWVGTEQGAARYDRLIEQWQRIGAAQGLTGSAVHDIACIEGLVYMLTDSAVCEYDPKYERWRVFRDESDASPVRDAFVAGGSAWLLRDSDMLRFDIATRVLRRYPMPGAVSFAAIRNVFIDGASFWIATADNLWQYDAQSDALRPFLEITALPDRTIRATGFSAGGDIICFSTASGVSRFDRSTKTWTFLTASSGMPVTEYVSLFPSGSGIVGRDRASFATWKAADNRWYTFPMLAAQGPSSGKAFFTLDPSRGTFFDFGNDYTLSFTGSRASWLSNYTWDEFGTLRTDASHRLDLKAKLDLGGDRSISAAYNDADYSDLQYGVQYRGAKSDIVQTAQWGDLRAEHGDRTLLQSFGIFGGGGRAVIGERTPKYHRGLVDLAGAAGHQTTRLTAEFFQGNTRTFTRTLRDIDFAQRRFFRLDSLQRDVPVDPSTVRVYTLLQPGDVTTNNAITARIAGVDGTWISTAHALDPDRGIIRLFTPPFAGQTLAATYSSGGRTVEILLTDSSRTTYEMLNVYAFSGTAILPGSFAVTLQDASTGQTQPLSAYGLDRDGDGRVDAEFLDPQYGFLSFPAMRPFSASAYADSATSSVILRFTYETLGGSFPLAHRQLIRGTERVLVDGLLARAGDDYILDYTSGTLTFTRDGVINGDSRIEVAYEFVEHKTDRKYAQVTATVSPSDLAQASVSAVRLTSADRTGDVYLLHAAVEGRFQDDNTDIRIVPEFSRSAREDGAGSNAYGFTAAASSGPLRVQAMGRRLEDNYVQMYEKRYTQGIERATGNARAEVDVSPELRLFAGWQVRNGVQLVSRAFSRDDAIDAGVKANPADLPAFTVRWQRLSDIGVNGASRRQALRADIDYAAPAGLLGAVDFSAATLTSYVRYSRERRTPPTGESSERDIRNYYLRLNISPRPLFIVNAYYRGDAERLLADGSSNPFLTDEKISADVIVEHVRGLSLTLRGTDTYRRMYARASQPTHDGDDRSSMQVAARFSPGVTVPSLQAFTVEVNTRLDRSAYYSDVQSDHAMFVSLFATSAGVASSSVETRFHEGKLEWRPSPDLLGITTGRYTATHNRLYATLNSAHTRELVQRVDLRPDPMTFVSAQGAWYGMTSPSGELSRLSPSVWLEHRWSRVVITRATGAANFMTMQAGLDETRNSQYSIGANVTLSFDKLPAMEKFETRYDVTWNAERGSSNRPPNPGHTSERRSISNTLALDLYPLPSSYIRLAASLVAYLPAGNVPAQQTKSLMLQVVLQL
ncbi:MAG: hypothetical protein IPP94_15470 [Ignavibacteria bacterium]|nr:hypothetical protein [Ignavibacteria bacterium]